MKLITVGLNHMSAPVAVRERLSVRAGDIEAGLAGLREILGLEEVALLSTCSRFEIYAAIEEPKAALKRMETWLTNVAQAPLEPYLYASEGEAAVLHLFRVAAGLESWIIGEDEILGQVKSAYQAAQSAGTSGRTLNILFQKALAAGKAVRTKTRITEGIRSIGGAAAVLARSIFGERGGRVLVFGAGTMAQSAVRHLTAKGVGSVWVANRTPARALELAATVGGRALGFEDGLNNIAGADIVIFSTSAERHVVGAKRLKEAVRARRGRPIFVIDLGVPRNVEPAAAEVDGVYLYDIDDLKRMVERSRLGRKEEMGKAEPMIREMSTDCWARLTRAVAPLK